MTGEAINGVFVFKRGGCDGISGIYTGGAMNGVFSFKSGGCEGISVIYTGGAINGVLGVNGGISDEDELGCGCRSEGICD